MAGRASSQQGSDPGEMFPLLESKDIHVAQEIKSEIQDSLNSGARDPAFLHALVVYYMKTNSSSALDILARVREPLDKTLLDKLNEFMMKKHTKLKSFTLLSHVVRHQPSWLYKIVEAPVFTTVLNCLKSDMEIPVIMCGLLAVTTLLPMIPSLLGPFLDDIFCIFARFTSWSVDKPGAIPDVYQLHLQVAVHALFHRLYGMYPWNFMEFLRLHYRNKLPEFNDAVLPMLERVRVHPLLVVGSHSSETDKARWRKMEVHDVLTECARLALDNTESSQEEFSVSGSFPLASSQHNPDRRGSSRARLLLEQIGRTSSPIVPSTGATPSGSEQNTPYLQRRRNVPADKIGPGSGSLVANQDETALSLWSPATMCPLSTPPSSRPPSPSSSQLDVSLSSVAHQYSVSQMDTPMTTPRDSPYPSGTDSARLSGNYSDVSTPSKFSQSSSKTSLHRKGVPPVLNQSFGALIPQMHSAPNTPGYVDTSQSGSIFKFQTFGDKSTAKHNKRPKSMGNVPSERPKSMGPIELRGSKVESDRTEIHGVMKVEDKPEPTSSQGNAAAIDTNKQERTSSSVSLRDLPDVMKEFSPREEDDLNEEVVSLVGSPFPDSGIEQLHPEDGDGSLEYKSHKQHSWPGAISMPEGSENSHRTKTTKPMSQSVGRRRDGGVYTFAPLSKLGEKSSLLSSYDGALANHLANESTESTSSGGSLDKAHRDDRSASTSTSGAHSASSKLQSTDAMSSENSASFRPINDRSLDTVESPFTMVSTHSTTSDHSFTTSGHHDPTLPMPYMHLYQNIIRGIHRKLPAAHPTDHSPASALDHSASVSSLPNMSFATPSPQVKRDSLQFSLNDSMSSTPSYTILSPSEILDRHIELGTNVHSKELSRLPLTSQASIDWTHFGGQPPADEITILKDQLVLLHTQLLYERHKREVHAERNRRLLGKTHKAKAYEESNRTMREQINLQNNEMAQISATLRLLQQQNRQLEEDIEKKEQQQHSLWQTLHTENENLKEANHELQKLLVDHKHQVDTARKERQHSEAELFIAKKELSNAQEEVATNRHLHDEIARLNRELLLMGEINEKYHEKVQKLKPTDCGTETEDLILAATKKELTTCRENLKSKTLLLEAAKCRIAELEATITQKDVAMTDQKRFLENVKGLSKGKVEAMESKYLSLSKANQRLEGHILKLNKRLSEKNLRDHPKRYHPKSSDPDRTQSRSERQHRHTNHPRKKSHSESAGGSARPSAIPRASMLTMTSSHEEGSPTKRLLGDTASDRSPTRRRTVDVGEDIARRIDDGSRSSDRSTPSGMISQEASPKMSNICVLGSQDSSPSSDWAHLSSELIASGRAAIPDKTLSPTEKLEVSGRQKRGTSPMRFSESSLFRRVSSSHSGSSSPQGSSANRQPSPSSSGTKSPRRSPRP